MRVMILGANGYLGWPTALEFFHTGHAVCLVDNLSKLALEASYGTSPLVPVPTLVDRVKWRNNRRHKNSVSAVDMELEVFDIATDYTKLYETIDFFGPDVIIHYAEQPSAPHSMANRETCIATQRNNIEGTLNLIHAVTAIDTGIHIIKLGTMGEYGTPNIDIEEGWLEIEHNGRKDRVLYPKKPGSWYHLSKVHDSHNLEFACRIHGLRVTDLNQGIVYGTNTKYASFALGDISFHYDHVFGTVLNRFLVQAMKDKPMTVYGNGSQKRGFLNIRDTMKCVLLAAENPADSGEFRVFNQFTEQFSVLELANAVKDAWGGRGIEHIENPRVEQEDHYYNAKNTGLAKLGLAPVLLTKKVIRDMAGDIINFLHRVDKDVIDPTVKWK